MSAPATTHAGPRSAARSTARPASRSARRWMAGSMLLAALAAVALFWLLVKPVSLQAGPLGLNYVETSDRVGTAGMPTRAQISRLADAGYRVVINLVPGDALGSHADEAAQVADRGMAYEHLPVDFARPTAEDNAQFAALMRKHAGQRVLVHCQLNMRASVFVYLYRVLELGEDPDLAFEAVQTVWQPSHPWRELIRELHDAHDRPLPFALESAA
jgi:protein tyrosine phosphatase (PTP) superfamily phosphohydrolase (DUF442 family)